MIELIVVVAIVAIMVALATPGWQSLQARNAIRALVNDYTLSVYYAKAEAVRQNAPVTVCPSADGTACTNNGLESGWVVFVGLADATSPTVLQDTPGRPRVRTSFTSNALANQAVTFLPNGQPTATFAGNTLRVCPTDAAFNTMSRQVAMNRTARITVTSPSNCN